MCKNPPNINICGLISNEITAKKKYSVFFFKFIKCIFFFMRAHSIIEDIVK